MHLVRYARPIGLALVAALLASCGGAGGSSSPPPGPPAATPPVITSANTASLRENSTGTIYQAAASSSPGAVLVWDIAGGADAALFAIDASGGVSFRSAANFDLPADQGSDNVYDVTVRVTTGGGAATRAVQITVTNDREGIKVTRIATGFVDPVGMASLLSDQHLIVAERGGRVFDLDGRTASRAEITGLAANTRAGELLDVAYLNEGNSFHRGILLLTHSSSDGVYLQGYDPVSGFKFQRQLAAPWAGPVQATLFATGRAPGEIMAGIGDPTGLLAQIDTSGYGKLFAVTPFDPYAGASFFPAITLSVNRIGRGLRAPSGGGLAGDQVLLADQGGSLQQELTRFQRAAAPLDFGWPTFEGVKATGSVTTVSGSLPVLAYDYGTGAAQGTGIVGGSTYSGTIAGIGGHYVFGDKRGAIFSIPSARLLENGLREAADIERRSLDFTPDTGTIDSPVDFVVANGTLFILDSDGEVFRVDQA